MHIIVDMDASLNKRIFSLSKNQNLVYRSYRCVNINVSELCPSLSGKATSPYTVPTTPPTGK